MSDAALVSSEWVAEAEAEAIQAKRKVEDAYAAYLVAKRYYDRVAAVAGNRRGVRDKRSYTPFPGVGTELMSARKPDAAFRSDGVQPQVGDPIPMFCAACGKPHPGFDATAAWARPYVCECGSAKFEGTVTFRG